MTLYDLETQILSMKSIFEVLKDVKEPKFEMLGFGSLLGYESLFSFPVDINSHVLGTI